MEHGVRKRHALIKKCPVHGDVGTPGGILHLDFEGRREVGIAFLSIERKGEIGDELAINDFLLLGEARGLELRGIGLREVHSVDRDLEDVELGFLLVLDRDPGRERQEAFHAGAGRKIPRGGFPEGRRDHEGREGRNISRVRSAGSKRPGAFDSGFEDALDGHAGFLAKKGECHFRAAPVLL